MKKLNLTDHLEESLKMLKTLNQEGLILVPSEPDTVMIQAAKEVCNLSEQDIRKLYFTMTSFANEDIPHLTN